MLIWFLDGVRQYRQIYLEEINSAGDGVDCWIVFKTATKLTSETCTASALILALTCTSTFGRHVNVDVDVAVHVVDFHVLGRRQSWCSLPHCRRAPAPASISTAWPPSLDCQRFDHVLEAKIETSLLGDGERQGVGNFGQLRRKLRPESGCSRLLRQVGGN